MVQYTGIDGLYSDLLAYIRAHGRDQHNQRTGHDVRALPSLHLRLDMQEIGLGNMQIPGWRKMFPKSALAEILWMLLGTTDPTWINQHTRMWELWTEEDGTIPTAYGHRWRHAFERDQLDLAMDALTRDPSSRQVNVFAWHPGKDGNGQPNQPKNIPCILGFTVNVIDGVLNMSVYLRSSDVIVGLPYDYMTYAFLQRFMSNTLNVRPGTLCLHLAHAHYYRVHDHIVNEIIDAPMTSNWIYGDILHTSLAEATDAPDGVMTRTMQQANPSNYHPRPELVL